MTAGGWSILGLALSWVGVLMLFVFGMPFRVRTGGKSSLLLEGTDEKANALDRRDDFFGYVGRALVSAGTGLQVYAAYLSMGR